MRYRLSKTGWQRLTMPNTCLFTGLKVKRRSNSASCTGWLNCTLYNDAVSIASVIYRRMIGQNGRVRLNWKDCGKIYRCTFKGTIPLFAYRD
jgi:hypothetical protein